MKRNIITIDRDTCNGCGQCIPNCPEGAIQIIDGKAHLISDLFCDGLGACIGTCPVGAITIEEREAEAYDELKVMVNIVKGGPGVIRAHLAHLKDHGQEEYYNQALEYLRQNKIPIPEKAVTKLAPPPPVGGCPGLKTLFRERPQAHAPESPPAEFGVEAGTRPSALRQWPIQLHLVNPQAPYFADADLVVAADCVAFTLNGFHERYLAGRTLIIFCPKLDNAREIYTDKLAEIFKHNSIRSITTIRMEVPCCAGTRTIVEAALQKAEKQIPRREAIISLEGTIQCEEEQ